MLTKARIAGHPIHPMLVAFPVAMYVATLVALVVYAGTYDPFWYRAAFWTNLAGVVMAAVAAIPGLVDLTSLPRDTRARVTGVRHASFNVLSLLLFVLSDILIGRGLTRGTFALAAPFVLAVLGCAATVCAGWLGWTMVQTHHVGVRPTTHAFAPEDLDRVDDLDELVPPVAPRAPTDIPLSH
ncbi:MAG TPA: DUF2231 domain-containing protein [Kofleriaceae bacterium]|nr:DUF2231 domain-containing protein [Kofleriaceae bacterium]